MPCLWCPRPPPEQLPLLMTLREPLKGRLKMRCGFKYGGYEREFDPDRFTKQHWGEPCCYMTHTHTLHPCWGDSHKGEISKVLTVAQICTAAGDLDYILDLGLAFLCLLISHYSFFSLCVYLHSRKGSTDPERMEICALEHKKKIIKNCTHALFSPKRSTM